MRSGVLVVGLVLVVWAPRARAAVELDPAALAEQVCRDRLGRAEAETAARTTEAARAASQAASDQAAAAARRDAKLKPDAEKRRAELDAATAAAAKADARFAEFDGLEAALCKIEWAKYVGSQFPIGFLDKIDPGFCKQLRGVADVNKTAIAEEFCAGVTTRSSGGLGTAAINLVLGVGDLLQAEAKQEVLDYLVEQLARRFCSYQHGDIDLKKWFAHTCGKLVPPAGKDGPDAEGFDISEIKAAFEEDARELPGYVGKVAHEWLLKRWPSADPYIGVAGALVLIGFDLHKHKKPGEIFEHLGKTADDASKSLRCDLTLGDDDAAGKPNRKACAGLLLFQLARTGAKAHAQTETPKLSVIIQDGVTAFCGVHGVDGKQKNGDCVIAPAHYAEWHARLLEFWRAARQMIDLQRSMDNARNTLPGELNKRAAPEVVKALRELVRTFSSVLQSVSPAEKDHIAHDTEVVDLCFDVYAALVESDPAALRKGLLGLLKSPVLSDKLPARTARAITVIVSLATAKDRAEVKDILSDVVASSSSYKAKYGADHVVVTFNGFVGFFLGGEYRLGSRATSGAGIAPVWKRAPFRLAAPLGFDFTLASWRKWHTGMFVSLVDPLALDVSDAGGTLHADWPTLFVPGLYLRLGAWRSPFALTVGGNYAVGRRSQAMCGSERCFDGAVQLGVTLSVDVPMFGLH